MSPAEPTPQRDEYELLATIKQLTRGTQGAAPADVADPGDTDGVRPGPAGLISAEDTAPGAQASGRTSARWSFVRRQVVESCSVALRHMGDANANSIAVTSTFRGEGRTTVAVGLAATAAVELRRKVILLDLDLEHPSIDKMTSLGPGPGVVDYLCEEATVDDCLQPLHDGVEVIRGGSRRDPADVLTQTGRLAKLVQEVSSRCEVMIADLPPLSSGVTTARIADLFQSVTLVVRAGKVAVPNIEQAASVLTQRPFVIMNGMEARRQSRLLHFLGLRS